MHPVIICFFIAVAQPIAAWGDVGHRTVGYLAQKYFTDQASNWVNSLLSAESGFDISDAAVWADAVRHDRPYTAGWHFIDAQDSPPSTCGVDFQRDCGTGCVVSAIMNQTSLVLDPNQDPTTRTEALMYLIHFLGDIHQPLHTESILRGGNEINICFDNRCDNENLHGTWDTDIIHKLNNLKHTEKHNQEKDAAANWANKLYNSSQSNGIIAATDECATIQDPEACAMQWATETNAFVCSYVLTQGVQWLESNDLGGDYYAGAVPIVEGRISIAGVRLAAWINALAATSGSASGFVVQHDGKADNIEL